MRKKIVNDLFPTALVVDYFTPGIKVCNEIRRLYTKQNIIFLVNHGLIITSDNYEELYELLDDVIEKFEKYQKLIVINISLQMSLVNLLTLPII